jgi:hypothetical protein
MTEPAATGQGQQDIAAQPVVTAPAVEPVSAPVTQEPPVATSGGKSIEELSREFDEKLSQISDVKDKLDRIEHLASLNQTLFDQMARNQGRPQEPILPDKPPVTDDEFLTNPAAATYKMLRHEREIEKAERDKERAAQTVMQTRDAFEKGKQAARSSPMLKGIELQVEQQMTAMVGEAMRHGQYVDPKELENPRYWEAAAAAYRIYKGEDLSKYYAKAPTNLVAPGHTEVPSAGGAPQGVVGLTEEEKLTARQWNVTDEQMLAEKRRSLAEKERLAR